MNMLNACDNDLQSEFLTSLWQLGALAKEWLCSGADIVSTATYQCTSDLLRREFELDEGKALEYMTLSWEVINTVRGEVWESFEPAEKERRRFPKIALSFGPWSAIRDDANEYSGLYDGLSEEDFIKFHLDRTSSLLRSLKKFDFAQKDVVAFETIGNNMECLAISKVMSAPELLDVPYWISFQCRNAAELASGEQLAVAVLSALQHCKHKNLVAIGINCVNVNLVHDLAGLISEAVEKFMSSSSEQEWRIDTVVYPNSGEIWTTNGYQWPGNKALSPTEWASLVWSADFGIVGGCCQTGPSFIRALHEKRMENDKGN